MFKFKRILTLLSGVCLLGACGNKEVQHLDIYFTADTLGFYAARPSGHADRQEIGGYGILKNFVQTLPDPYLLFDGGNWYGAAAEATLTKGSFITPFLQEIPYTAAVLSPADFSYGWPSLRAIIRVLPYPFVVSNLRLENTLPWPVHDYQIRTFGKLKVGIFGIMDTPAVHGKDVRLPGMTVLDPVQTAQEMSALLKEKQVDYIIVLSSLGLSQNGGVSDLLLSQEVEGIDLILSSNQDREQLEAEEVNHTWVVYPGSRLNSVAHIRISFDKNKQVLDTQISSVLLEKEKYAEDFSLTSRALNLRNDTKEKMNKKISAVPTEIPTYVDRESPLGALLAQCIHKWAKLDGAVLNAASIQGPLLQGDVMESDLYKIYPYGDNITFLTLKGKVLQQALQASLNAEDNFPQLAGMRVKYNTFPAGKLIKQVILENGRIIRPNETYRIAVTDHILAGGFGHDGFIDSLEFKNTYVEARQIFRTCLLRYKQVQAPEANHFEEVK